MGNRHWNLQLTDRYTGFSIITAGGTCQVCTAGTPDKATLFNAAGASLANPITPVRGMIDFYVVDTVLTVDLYVMSAGGQFVVMYGVSSSGPGEIYVDTSDKLQWAIIPFSIADAVANTEKDTGFDLPAKAWVLDRLHGLGISVFAIDAGQNILFGLLSTGVIECTPGQRHKRDAAEPAPELRPETPRPGSWVRPPRRKGRKSCAKRCTWTIRP